MLRRLGEGLWWAVVAVGAFLMTGPPGLLIGLLVGVVLVIEAGMRRRARR